MYETGRLAATLLGRWLRPALESERGRGRRVGPEVERLGLEQIAACLPDRQLGEGQAWGEGCEGCVAIEHRVPRRIDGFAVFDAVRVQALGSRSRERRR